ncbi:xanthine dehydrogenase [Sphingomonas metalli]|uniref:Xanthine dehydrogenase n=1 Tax=Sphingomonas metalli TaxID=1779358 RepID=A0A916TDX9_9SPHN|nr:xanthine dehydrogenase family protein molybdopterin-binding subunit [Sphingomonas metalli]GGB41239.1 xanthine dehydrogenase [Sphingomonas metalli]
MFGFGEDNVTLTMDKPQPVSRLDTTVQGLVGTGVERVDGPAKVSGRATYAAEYRIDDVAYGVLVGAGIGKGKVVSIDADAVKSLPGVIDVVTDYDTFIRVSQQGGETEAPTQGVRDVEYFGEIVAIVLGETYEAARDAALRLPIDYETEEGVFAFSMEAERDGDLPPNNTPAQSAQGDVEAAMAKAAVTIDATYTTPSQNSAAMEPHASLAMWGEDGSLTLYGAYQMPTSDAQQLADALGLSKSKVRIVSRYIGGGFGSKLGIAPESVAAAVAAKRLGRPVKAVMMRQQVFDATVRRSNTSQRMRLAATADGRLTAIGHETTASNLSTEDYFEPAGISTHFLYAGENRLISHDLVRVNWLLSGSMRAPGEAVGLLGLECAMDELAEALALDPIELRIRNDPGRDPEKDVPFSSRALKEALRHGADHFGWDRRQAAGTRREGDWLVGMGVASAARANILMKGSAKVALDPDGTATVTSAMTDIGTGSYTILAQIAADMLGLPLDRVRVELGDTNHVPSGGSGGSWGAASSGSAVYLAAQALRAKLAKAMGVEEEELTLKDGQAIGANRQVALAELLDGKPIEAVGTIDKGAQEKLTTQASYGAHFAEVAVDVVTGEVRVRRMLGVFAAGRILNQQTARSQCLGGMTFGIGGALHEELMHDARTGKLVNRDLAEYHVPVNADVPDLEVIFLPERDIHANPIHAKGIGELGICGAGAAVANAIYNATGVRIRDFPITLDKLLPHLPAM